LNYGNLEWCSSNALALSNQRKGLGFVVTCLPCRNSGNSGHSDERVMSAQDKATALNNVKQAMHAMYDITWRNTWSAQQRSLEARVRVLYASAASVQNVKTRQLIEPGGQNVTVLFFSDCTILGRHSEVWELRKGWRFVATGEVYRENFETDFQMFVTRHHHRQYRRQHHRAAVNLFKIRASTILTFLTEIPKTSANLDAKLKNALPKKKKKRWRHRGVIVAVDHVAGDVNVEVDDDIWNFKGQFSNFT